MQREFYYRKSPQKWFSINKKMESGVPEQTTKKPREAQISFGFSFAALLGRKINGRPDIHRDLT